MVATTEGSTKNVAGWRWRSQPSGKSVRYPWIVSHSLILPAPRRNAQRIWSAVVGRAGLL